MLCCSPICPPRCCPPNNSRANTSTSPAPSPFSSNTSSSDVETVDHRRDALARLAHAQHFEHGVAEGPAALVDARERDLRHGVLQHPGTDRMPFGVVGVQEALG